MLVRHMLGVLMVTMLAATSVAAQSGDVRLAEAAKSQDMSQVRSLIAERVDLDIPDSEGMTALHWAAHWGDLETVELLISEGAKARASNRYGVTPLHEASNLGNAPMIEALLEAGADPNAAYGAGETPVMTASRTGVVDAVRALLDHGGAVDAREEWRGQTALMWAAVENLPEMAQFLIDQGASVNARSTFFEFEAIETSNAGVLVDRPTGDLSPLFFAARDGSLEVGEILIAEGADVNPGEVIYGFTPLQTAIINGHWDFAVLLIDNGADINDGALYTAIEARNTPAYTIRPAPPDKDRVWSSIEVIELLLDRGADASQVYTKEIPERQAQGKVTVPGGATPLYRAAVSMDVDSIRLLMEHGASPAAAMNDGSTSLMALAGMRARGRYDNAVGPTDPIRLELIQMFWEAGASVNTVQTRSGNTALHYAAQRGADRIVEFLTAAGASLYVENEEGETPRDLAAVSAASLTP